MKEKRSVFQFLPVFKPSLMTTLSSNLLKQSHGTEVITENRTAFKVFWEKNIVFSHKSKVILHCITYNCCQCHAMRFILQGEKQRFGS
ncbi:hypothetical protein BgiMline_022413 [Biomphalaria glabrata]